MITSEEAKLLSIQFRKNSLQLNTELKLFGVRRVCQKDVYNLEHDKLDKYITQQEKVNELLELKNKLISLYELKITRFQYGFIMQAEMVNIFEVEEKIKELESELND